MVFFVGFAIVMALSYRKDKQLHRKYYKGSLWVLVFFLVFMCLLLAIRHFGGKS